MPTRKSINQPLARVFNQLLVPFEVLVKGPNTPGVWPERNALHGMPSHLCTAVYQPAASVRLMATSTGIMSATASLLAMTVRRIPLPACGTQRDRESHPPQAGLRFNWQDSSSVHCGQASMAALFSAADYLVSVTTKTDFPWTPLSCIFQRKPGNVMMPCAVCNKKSLI